MQWPAADRQPFLNLGNHILELIFELFDALCHFGGPLLFGAERPDFFENAIPFRNVELWIGQLWNCRKNTRRFDREMRGRSFQAVAFFIRQHFFKILNQFTGRFQSVEGLEGAVRRTHQTQKGGGGRSGKMFNFLPLIGTQFKMLDVRIHDKLSTMQFKWE